jgi:hypothetical protein
MTPPQRLRRLRQIDARRTTLEAELRALDTEARPLENEHSWSLGFRVPLRGKALIDEADRLQRVEEGRAVA